MGFDLTMPSTEIIRFAELTESKWKNGGGITREIACAAINENRIWRLSMADVASDGPFSAFDEYERILTVLKGEGITLQSDEGNIDADLWQPVRFSGALKIHGQLKSGPLTDLNLMFNPDYCSGDVTALHGPHNQSLELGEGCMVALHSLAGTVKMNDGTALLPGDTAIIGTDVIQVELTDGDAALLIKIDLSDQVSRSDLAITTR